MYLTSTEGRSGTQFFRICLGACLGLTACGAGDLPTAPAADGAVRLDPTPDTYQGWWHEVEVCSGKTGNFNAIAWYYIPNVHWFAVGSTPTVLGYWQPSRHSITLAGVHINDAYLVRHEALHVILNTVDHPPEYFEQKCATAVVRPDHMVVD